MRKAVLVLAWWFVVYGGPSQRHTTVIGPFMNEQQCTDYKQMLANHKTSAWHSWSYVFPCWSDGKN